MTALQPTLAASLTGRARELAVETAHRHLATRPGLLARFPAAEVRCIDDGAFHVRHLAAALAMGRPELFDEYLIWTSLLLAGYGIEREELVAHVQTLAEVIASDPDTSWDDAAAVRDLVGRAVAALSVAPAEPASFLSPDEPHGVLARTFLEALLQVDRRAASQLVMDAAGAGVPIEELYLHVFQPCLREVGRLWQIREATVAQEHFVTAAIQVVMAQLSARLFATPRIGRSVLVASVGGELHEVGGRMLADIFELRGWDSRFTGANTPSDGVAGLAAEHGVDVVAVSATLLSHLPAVEEVVRAVRAASSAKILVGGRPFVQTPALSQVVGADGTAPDAVAAVARATDLMIAS